MLRVVLTSQASEDIQEIWSYIAQHSAVAADRIIDRLDQVFGMLAGSSELGEKQDRLRPGMRRFVEGKYAVFYEIAMNSLRVLRVVHGARNIDELTWPPQYPD